MPGAPVDQETLHDHGEGGHAENERRAFPGETGKERTQKLRSRRDQRGHDADEQGLQHPIILLDGHALGEIPRLVDVGANPPVIAAMADADLLQAIEIAQQALPFRHDAGLA